MVFLVALLIAGLLLVQRLWLGYPRPPERYVVLAAWEVAFLGAAADAFFPPGGAMLLAGRDAGLPGHLDQHLTNLPVRQRRQIRALFLLFEQSTLLLPARGPGAFRRFSAMTHEQRQRVLRGWAESPLAPRRLAFTALKALLIMGYFGHERCLRQLGVEPFEIEPAVIAADLLYPQIGQAPESIRHGPDDLTPVSEGIPLRASERRP